MEMDVVLSSSKWNILSELSKNLKSPLELSRIFGTTVANISQQLRLLEAMGIVSKVRVSNSGKGKPRMQYFIKNEIFYLVRLGKNLAAKQSLKLEGHNAYTFNVLASQSKKDHFHFLKFFWLNPEILTNSSIGLFKNNGDVIEFFIITENLEDARKKLSHIEITNPAGCSRKMICWTHNSKEVEEGRSEEHTSELQSH